MRERTRVRTSSKSALAREIEALEKSLEGCGDFMEMEDDMSYMDEVDEYDDDVIELDEADDIEVDEYMDDDSEDWMELEASESGPGVEDEISQEYLSEVVDETANGGGATTHDSMRHTASRVDRLRSASERLDRVAEYLEGKGMQEHAYRIDRIADRVDAEIKKEENR